MNEIIEKYYQEEVNSGSERLLRGQINNNWDKLMNLFRNDSEIMSQNDVFTMIGDIATESAKNGFETGFRTAIRFMMSL